MSQEQQTIKVDSVSHNRNRARAERDKEELAQLIKEHMGDEGTSDIQQDSPEEVTQESNNSIPQATEATPVEVKQTSETKEEVTDAPLSKEEESFKKRYGDLRRHMQEKEQETKIELEKLKAQLSQAAKNELVLPKTEQDIEAWVKKYPDVAGIVEAIADKKAQERSSDLDSRLKEIEELRFQAKRDKAEAELLQLHPDFETIRSDDAFHGWADEQPKWVQDALYENSEDAKSVARVIDLYKADSGISGKKGNSSDKSAASSVRTKRTATPNYDESADYIRESQVAKMSIKEYEKRAEDIFEAQRNGKFIYDVSKK